MKRSFNKKLVTLIIPVIMFIVTLGQQVMTAEAVTTSKQGYVAYLNEKQTYLCNQKPIDGKVGDEYFITYTVQEVEEAGPSHHGLIVTDDCTQDWPYTNGGFMRYTLSEDLLLQEGATYFIKFKIAEGGFRYNVTCAKGSSAENIYFDLLEGEHTAEIKYFGVWFSDKVKAQFTNIHCYDAEGNDLGIQIADNAVNYQGMVLKENLRLKNNTKVDHSYDIYIADQFNIALSNRRYSTTNKVYMEYTVEAADYVFAEEGIALNNEPFKHLVYENGLAYMNQYPEATKSVKLLDVGASYIISMERTSKGLDVFVQKTKAGKQEILMFDLRWGPFLEEDSQFYSLFFGNGGTLKGTLHLTNFKIYDGNNNNLGVQCNRDVTMIHRGEVEDYAGCEALYYCNDNSNLFALYADKTVKYQEKNASLNGTYKISDNVMDVTYEDQTAGTYDYLYKRIQDSDGNIFERLFEYKVTFVTDTDMEIPEQTLSNEYGYLVMKPDDPVKEGEKFDGWYTSKGEKFDFDKLVTQSTTLYAKYEGENLPIQNGQNVQPAKIVSIPVVIVISLLVVGIGAAVFVVVKRGKKSVSNEKK